MADSPNETPDDTTDSTDESADAGTDPPDALTDPVERGFTCTVCGYETVHEVPLLRASVGSTCANCGDWTIQTAAEDTLVDAAERAADLLADEVLTERQAFAYFLRDVLGPSRDQAAEAMESTPSNVDNLQRRAREKLEDARRLVAGVDALLKGADGADGGNEG